MKFKLIPAVLIVILCGAGLKPKIPVNAKITMYAEEGSRYVEEIQNSLSYRDMTCRMIYVSSMEEIVEMGLKDKLTKAGMATGFGRTFKVPLPFFRANGNFFTMFEFKLALPPVPKRKLFERRGPYIIVYGEEISETTRVKMNELEDAGLQYVYRDVNDPDVMIRVNLLREGAGITGYGWPIIDVSGHVLLSPSIDTVLRYYRVKKVKKG